MHDTDIIGIRRCLGGVIAVVRLGVERVEYIGIVDDECAERVITSMMPLAAPTEIYDAWIFSSDSDGTFVFAKRGAVSDLFIVIYTGDGPVVIGFRR
jgi:hypothetical protein